MLEIKTPLCGVLSNLQHIIEPPQSLQLLATANTSQTITTQLPNQLQYDQIQVDNQVLETDFYSSFNLGH